MSRVVYTALSRHSFYANMIICAFVFRKGVVPLNPFNMFGYFLYDMVDRDTVRAANGAVIDRVDEVWAFGPISNGVAVEVLQAYTQSKEVRYFSVEPKVENIVELLPGDLIFETGVQEQYGLQILAYANEKRAA